MGFVACSQSVGHMDGCNGASMEDSTSFLKTESEGISVHMY